MGSLPSFYPLAHLLCQRLLPKKTPSKKLGPLDASVLSPETMDPEPSAANDATSATSELGTKGRLSQSIVWPLQRAYYDEVGIDAWRSDRVPHYVTNNCVLARAEAMVALGFLRDCATASPPLDPREPFTIVELGAGSGRFAYLFLKAFTEMHKRSSAAGVRLRYVMTDFTEKNLRYWRDHPKLRPFVEQGVLDFALFDMEQSDALDLIESKITIRAGDLKNPLGVIANYVLDSVPNDVFSTEQGALFEELVSLTAADPPREGADPGLLERLSPSLSRRPAEAAYYHDDPELNDVLRRSAEGASGSFLFPCVAIRCLRRLSALASGRMLLLSADYGDVERAPWNTVFARHGGCISLPVNYHALGEWARARGGRAVTAPHRSTYLIVTALLLGDYQGDETTLAYEQAVEAAGPDDWCVSHRGVHVGIPHLGLDPLLSAIRMSHWDPAILRECLPGLWSHVAGATESQRKEVLRTITRVWANYYWMGERYDLAFELGLLAHGYGGHTEALAFFAESVALHGDDPRTRWDMGLCHWAMGRVDEALMCFGASALLDPTFCPIGTLQVKDQLSVARAPSPA